jgi:AbrB family looped-hinge helix DNA binding protein
MPNVLTTTSNTNNREYVSSVSPKGQITLPLEVRNRFGIKDTVVISVDIDEIKISPTRATFLDSYQAIPPLKKPLNFAEIRRIALEEHATEASRTNS